MCFFFFGACFIPRITKQTQELGLLAQSSHSSLSSSINRFSASLSPCPLPRLPFRPPLTRE